MRQLGKGKPIGLARAEAVRAVEVVGTKRLRQSAKGPNKTEAAFAAYLRTDMARRGLAVDVLEQSITLSLANGCRYTPDIVTVYQESPHGGHYVTAYEVKGFMRDDAVVKLKVAARAYPWIQFVLVTAGDRARSCWNTEEVRP